MVCNRSVDHVHEDLTTFALRPYYVLQVPTTSSPRPCCVLIPPLATFLLRIFIIRPRPPNPPRSRYVLTTFLPRPTRPYYVLTASLNVLRSSKDVVRTWPSVDVTLDWYKDIYDAFGRPGKIIP